MTNIFLRGCGGRMGAALSRLCDARDDVAIAAGLDLNPNLDCGYPVYTDPADVTEPVDVAVDFSVPDGISNFLDVCVARNIPLVLCSTGHTDAMLTVIETASRRIPLLKSGNMSLGVHLLMDLCRRAAAVLGADFDVEIIEKHHHHKKDAPSGTALMLKDAVCDGRRSPLHPVYDRHETTVPRSKDEIGIHAVRGGTIVGEHEVIFAGKDEVITLSHAAGSRELFAVGALRAAVFLANAKTPGLYTMRDVIDGESR